MRRSLQIAFLTLVLALIGTRANAQQGDEHLSPFARGAGATYAITSRGLDATGINPALLGLGTPRPVEISIFPISSFGASAGASFNKIDTITNNLKDSTSLGDTARANIVNLLFNNMLSGSADARLFGLSYYKPELGTFALTWTMHAAVNTSLPDELLNFFGPDALAHLVNGIPLYITNGIDLQGMWYAEYGLSFGRYLMKSDEDGGLDLLGGVGLKYVAGIAYARVDPNYDIAINYPHQPGGSVLINAHYSLQFAYPDKFDPQHLPTGFSFDLLTSATAGSGVAGDLGFVLQPHSSSGASPWSIGVSLADLGSIHWTKHTDRRTLIGSKDTSILFSSSANNTHITDSIRGLAGVLDTTDAAFTSKLPTTLHVAAAIDLAGLGIMPGNMQFSAAAEYAKGLTDVVGSPQNGRFGVGLILEKPDPTFSFHAAVGMTTQDGTTDATLGFGIGLWNSFLLDLGTDGITGLFSANGKSDVAFSMKLLF